MSKLTKRIKTLENVLQALQANFHVETKSGIVDDTNNGQEPKELTVFEVLEEVVSELQNLREEIKLKKIKNMLKVLTAYAEGL